MPSITSLIRAHETGNAESLQTLAVALHGLLDDTPTLPTDPAEHWSAVDTRGAEQRGTWQEVRAAHDHGDLTDAEYEYLAAALEHLDQEA
jgi:hypothetical protein